MNRASGSSVTDEKLSAQSERSEIFHFIFSELQQVLPYLPQTSSLEEGSHYGRITQPVVNFLLAKLALNAEIYMYNDWAQGYRKRPKGRDPGIYGAYSRWRLAHYGRQGE